MSATVNLFPQRLRPQILPTAVLSAALLGGFAQRALAQASVVTQTVTQTVPQDPPPQPPALPTVLIDPARGGSEDGARVAEHAAEKDVTLALANSIGSLLRARGFNVVFTRDSDVSVSNEERAATANTSNAIACLLLHATGSGSGVHLWTSALNAEPMPEVLPWDTAQAPFVPASQKLADELRDALSRSHLSVSAGRTWVRPLDNMLCPAVALEVAPEKDGTTPDDSSYQSHIADALAGAMLFWKSHVPPRPQPPAPPAIPLASGTASPGGVRP